MNEILDVFYNDFIKEAATGRIDCNMFYNILFATNILRDGKVEMLTTAKTNYQNVMVPTLEIKNEREWNDLLIKYVEQAIDFYDSKDFEDVDNIPKSIMARLFANMTLEDFKEPERFLKKRIAFLEDDTILSLPNDLGYVSTLDANLRLVVKKKEFRKKLHMLSIFIWKTQRIQTMYFIFLMYELALKMIQHIFMQSKER